MRLRQVAPDIFIVRFRSQYELASTFLRFQEHYESKRFRNRIFSLEEFMDWYAHRNGAFTYFQDWSGFNIPSTAFTHFYAGKFDPLLRKEQRLLRLFKARRRPFYVIGITSDEDLTHELAHALYFMQPEYRRAVQAVLRRHDTSSLRRKILAMGYHTSVATDEVQAYLIGSRGVGKAAKRHARISNELRAIYRRHAAAFTVR